MGFLNVPFCSIFKFVPLYFYRIMTLVVPRLDNIFIIMVLLISALGNIRISATNIN